MGAESIDSRPGKYGARDGSGCDCVLDDDYADGRDDVCTCPNGDCDHYCKTHDIFHCPYAHDQSRTREGLRCIKCGRRIHSGASDNDDEHHPANDTGPVTCDRCSYDSATDGATDGASLYDAATYADIFGWEE